MKENNNIFSLGKLFDKNALVHFLGCVAVYLFTYYMIYVLNLDEALQIPKIVAGIVTLTVAFLVEYYQMRISRGKIDVADLLVAFVAIVVMYLIPLEKTLVWFN